VLLLLRYKDSEFWLAKDVFSNGHSEHHTNGIAVASESSLQASSLTIAKPGPLRISATLDAVRRHDTEETRIVVDNTERHLKKSKGGKRSKKSRQQYTDYYDEFVANYNDDDMANISDSTVDEPMGSKSQKKRSKKRSKKLFSGRERPERFFVVVLNDFAVASETNVVETFGTSYIMDRDITLLLNVPSQTDIYLIEGIVVAVRHRNLISASDFTCPPASYDKYTTNASGRLFFRIPGDVNSVTVFCDDGENVIGIYVHIVIANGEIVVPASPAPVGTRSPTLQLSAAPSAPDVVTEPPSLPPTTSGATASPTVQDSQQPTTNSTTGTSAPSAAVVGSSAPTVVGVVTTAPSTAPSVTGGAATAPPSALVTISPAPSSNDTLAPSAVGAVV
jgi:hypothetical protein